MQQEAELGGWHRPRLHACDLHIDLLAKLWLRERHVSGVYLEPYGNRNGRDLHIIMLMRSPCWKAKKEQKPKRGLKLLSPSGQEQTRSKLKRGGRGQGFGLDGTAVGSSPLGSPPTPQMGLPSRDTTTFPPSFSARVLRSWMSSSPFTCHSCLIPERWDDVIRNEATPPNTCPGELLWSHDHSPVSFFLMASLELA